jgi:DNA-binding GntR family transcriptional regulator
MPLPVNPKPIARRTARNQVFVQLREWIEDGVLRAGEVIRDAEIAEHLGVSRTPVREALQKLEHQAIVEVIPGKHTRVASARKEDAELVYPPMAALQALAAEIATPLATSDDLEAMKQANKHMLSAAKANRATAARRADIELHNVLVQRADNPHISSAIETLQMHCRRLETLYFRHAAPAQRSYREHSELIKAVAAHDAARAKDLTWENVRRFIPTPAR